MYSRRYPNRPRNKHSRLAGAPLTARELAPEDLRRSVLQHGLLLAVTDDTGSFRIGELPPGRHRIAATRWRDSQPMSQSASREWS